jgi:hypothetical protein
MVRGGCAVQVNTTTPSFARPFSHAQAYVLPLLLCATGELERNGFKLGSVFRTGVRVAVCQAQLAALAPQTVARLRETAPPHTHTQR